MLTTIKFREFGRVYTNINIKPKSGYTMIPISFKIDSGADSTTISKKTLYRLGYDDIWIQKHISSEYVETTTASGERVRTYQIQLPLINLLGYEAKNWPFGILLDDEKANHTRNFRNLLGRDLLTGFNYRFDNDNDCLEIERAASFKYRIEPLAGQEIHVLLRDADLPTSVLFEHVYIGP